MAIKQIVESVYMLIAKKLIKLKENHEVVIK